MKKKLALVVPSLLLAACASGGGLSSLAPASSSSEPAYWRAASMGTSPSEFARDNVNCSSRAARLGNVDNAPQNRFDRPMQKWPNATAQETYESCMADAGWRPQS